VQVVGRIVRQALELAAHGRGGQEVEGEQRGEPLPVGRDLPHPGGCDGDRIDGVRDVGVYTNIWNGHLSYMHAPDGSVGGGDGLVHPQALVRLEAVSYTHLRAHET